MSIFPVFVRNADLPTIDSPDCENINEKTISS